MSCRSVLRSPSPLSRGARIALAAVGACALGAGPLSVAANAQTMQLCSGYGAGFMRMPNSDSCVKVGGGVQAQGFSGGSLTNNANPGTGMSIDGGTSPSSLASSTMSAPATTASPLTSISSATGANAGAPVVDPWKQAR